MALKNGALGDVPSPHHVGKVIAEKEEVGFHNGAIRLHGPWPCQEAMAQCNGHLQRELVAMESNGTR